MPARLIQQNTCYAIIFAALRQRHADIATRVRFFAIRHFIRYAMRAADAVDAYAYRHAL